MHVCKLHHACMYNPTCNWSVNDVYSCFETALDKNSARFRPNTPLVFACTRAVFTECSDIWEEDRGDCLNTLLSTYGGRNSQCLLGRNSHWSFSSFFRHVAVSTATTALRRVHHGRRVASTSFGHPPSSCIMPRVFACTRAVFTECSDIWEDEHTRGGLSQHS